MTRKLLTRTRDMRNTKDITWTDTETTVPMSQSPVLVDGPGLWSPDENRDNNTSYAHEIKSHYYVPTRKVENENNRLYPQQVRKYNNDVSIEIVPLHKIMHRINKETSVVMT